MINGHKVIDAHCHIYPEKIAEKAVANTDMFYGTVSQGLGTGAELIARGDAAGIDRFIVCSVATTAHQVQRINEFIAEEVAKYPSRFVGLGTMYPFTDTLKEDFDHLVSLGLHGVKLHPDIQRFAVDDPKCMPIYAYCENAGIPVLFHSGDCRYDFSNPNRLKKVLDSFPKMTVIGAHFGGWSIWSTAVDEYRDYPNFYVDCSSSFYYITPREGREIVKKYGIDKVMFGTDYPMWRAEDELKAVLGMKLTEDEYEKLFSLNAEKVYGISH